MCRFAAFIRPSSRQGGAEAPGPLLRRFRFLQDLAISPNSV